MTAFPVLPLHLGGLHPYESLLLAVVAFGPFVVLACVVVVVRRRDIAEEQAHQLSPGDSSSPEAPDTSGSG